MAQVLWVVMILTLLSVIAAAFTHFDAGQVFTFPAHAFDITRGSFWIGFAGGLTVGVYDYLGYNTTAYLGRRDQAARARDPALDHLRDPRDDGRLPGHADRHPRRRRLARDAGPESQAYTSVASLVLERTLGGTAAKVVTVFILVTAFTSVLAGLLAGSRVPYDAARDGVFFRSFARLHPRHEFPTVGLLTMGVVTAAGFVIGQLTSLTVLIQLLTVVMVLVQALAQIVAVTVLRRRQPDLRRPVQDVPVPAAQHPGRPGLAGDLRLRGQERARACTRSSCRCSGSPSARGRSLLWARSKREWPFGPKHIEEQYLNADPRLLELDEEDLAEPLRAATSAGARRA